MKLFSRIVDYWLHAVFFIHGPQQEALQESSPSTLVTVPGHDYSLATTSAVFADDCKNTATSRQCWSKGFNITTDYEYHTPDTGVVRQYTLVLENKNIAPDGYIVPRMVINGTYPGPLIEADWGDTLNITVINKLVENHNGTSIHWHGIRQLNTTWQDGVAGVTQCPIPPLQQYTYTWRATQYGVSWYHSHFSLQYPDGLVGPLKINGPTSMNYTKDLGPVLVTDWLHKDAFSQFQLELLGRPPVPDSNLINGKGPFYCCRLLDKQCTGNLSFTEFNFTSGESYKMSLVNTAVSTHFTFWIDGHDMWVVANDFVPIVPYRTQTLNIAIGQRYDIVIKAKDTLNPLYPPNFWMHARDCQNIGQRSELGIIRYQHDSKLLPISVPPDRLCVGCLDEESLNLRPIVSRTVGSSSIPYNEDHSLEVYLQGFPNAEDQNSVLHKWVLKDSSFYLDWREPSLSLITMNGDKMADPFPREYVPVFIDKPTDSWVYFLIEGNFTQRDKNIYKRQAPVAHPIHIHGHDFVILASGNHTYDPAKDKPQLNNPPRRDVALLPVNGFLLIAFQVNNPGTWLMHCHIAWHASGGLALQFVEKQKEIVPLMSAAGVFPQYFDTCARWGAYYKVFNEKFNLTMEDSGI